MGNTIRLITRETLLSGPAISLNYACTLLEYCLITGLNWMDMLFCLRPSMIETLCDRLDASYNRQPPATQHYHYMRFLCIKISLYRYVPFNFQQYFIED